jgi:hypothetical protein
LQDSSENIANFFVSATTSFKMRMEVLAASNSRARYDDPATDGCYAPRVDLDDSPKVSGLEPSVASMASPIVEDLKRGVAPGPADNASTKKLPHESTDQGVNCANAVGPRERLGAPSTSHTMLKLSRS